jgi:hypothetical protein
MKNLYVLLPILLPFLMTSCDSCKKRNDNKPAPEPVISRESDEQLPSDNQLPKEEPPQNQPEPQPGQQSDSADIISQPLPLPPAKEEFKMKENIEKQAEEEHQDLPVLQRATEEERIVEKEKEKQEVEKEMVEDLSEDNTLLSEKQLEETSRGNEEIGMDVAQQYQQIRQGSRKCQELEEGRRMLIAQHDQEHREGYQRERERESEASRMWIVDLRQQSRDYMRQANEYRKEAQEIRQSIDGVKVSQQPKTDEESK